MNLQLPVIGLLTKFLPNLLASLVHWSVPSIHESACLSLKSGLHLENTTITQVSYVYAGSRISIPGPCTASTDVGTSVCRIEFSTQTSETSSVRAEAWLPDEWYGRFLALGNGGLGGCIDYAGLNYGSALHFGTVGSNNGHDGNDGIVFLDQPEVINDFAFRAIHVEAVIGKQLVEAYYQRAHSKAYYLGCSTGGRQGTQAALKFPEDFDGILAGGMNARNIGSPTPWSSPAHIPLRKWHGLIAKEILNQCDELDGVKDGIITEPDDCDFQPETLLFAALRKIYAPLYVDGKLVYPRFDPGAESDPGGAAMFSGVFPGIAKDWVRYAVLNDSTFDLREYGDAQLHMMDKINPGGISTFDGDLSAFREHGGKFLTYHGRMDPLIASGNSKRYYDLVAESIGTPDDFYRLFLVPGMGHCAGGPGAVNFGQLGGTAPPVSRNDSEHNILLALVEWVEGGIAPETIVGSSGGGDGRETRRHCRYPAAKSVWDGSVFYCEFRG
ncbi:tannase and feruloyl esterase [Mycena amicta]|nr:tannase and feruloyl esterase [Mycena amicta]